MKIWLFGIVLLMITQVCSSTFRALGDTKTSATIAISMTLINLILDPILIFGLGPFPELGMQGAALATVIAVTVASLIGLYQLGIKERLLLSSLPSLEGFKDNFKQLIDIAIPAVLANAIVPITGAMLTTLVARFGTDTDTVAGFGVGSRIEAISLMIVYAMSSTLPMFIGQNLGAGKPERITAALKLNFKFIIILQLAIYLILVSMSGLIAALFSIEIVVQETIVLFLLIVPISYGLSGVVVLVNVSMNVLGKPRIALYINLLRLTMLYFSLAYFGSYAFGIKGLFAGIAIGNCLAFCLALILLKRVLRDVHVID
ncbi:MAG: putative MATE family efflux protein [Arenicella sp.]|jgi:putative MATE family efflux protein